MERYETTDRELRPLLLATGTVPFEKCVCIVTVGHVIVLTQQLLPTRECKCQNRLCQRIQNVHLIVLYL